MIAVIPDNLETLAPIVRPAGALGAGAFSPYGRRRSFISLGRELGGKAAQDFTKSFSLQASLIVGVRHEREDGEAYEQGVAKSLQGFARVCT